jgi:hypothetical protein
MAVAAAGAAIGGSALVACSSTPAVCSDLAAVQTTLHQLTNLQLGQDTLHDLQSHLQKLDKQVRTLASDASNQYSPEISAVRSSLHKVQSAATSAVSSPSAASVSQLRTDVHGLTSSIKQLSSAASNTC